MTYLDGTIGDGKGGRCPGDIDHLRIGKDGVLDLERCECTVGYHGGIGETDDQGSELVASAECVTVNVV